MEIITNRPNRPLEDHAWTRSARLAENDDSLIWLGIEEGRKTKRGGTFHRFETTTASMNCTILLDGPS